MRVASLLVGLVVTLSARAETITFGARDLFDWRSSYSQRYCYISQDQTRLVSWRGRDKALFYVFDRICMDGEDMRSRQLIERKPMVRKLVL